MAAPTLDLDLAASAIALSGLYGVNRAAEKLGLHPQTIKRYRQLMLTRPELRVKVDERRKLLEGDWANELPGAIRQAIDFLDRASRAADPKDPDAIHSIAGALKILHECAGSKRVLDVRLGARYGENAGVSRPAGSAGPSDRPGPQAPGGSVNGVEPTH